jgi:SAM-dependent methyltransferase
MDELRRAGVRLAADYDAMAYALPADPYLRPRVLLGFGAVFGCPGALGDVLDLGCGAGVQLAQAGAEASGRLVGVDLSGENCRRARERLAPLGDRVRIHHGDLIDMAPEALGQFDLIHAVGLVFAVPPAVRAHVLGLIGACLRPGGVALISHYAGTMSKIRAELHRQVRDAVEAGLPPSETITRGREAMIRIATDQTPQLQEAARLSASLDDSSFFHEVFNPFCEPVCAGELDLALAPGVRFLGHLDAPASALKPDARARALASDALDQTGGGYHHALFGKDARPPDLTAAHVLWSTVLRPAGGGLYRAGSREIPIAHAPTRAALDAIAFRPQPFLKAAPPQEREVTARLFRDLWAQRLVTPLRQD